jgi:ABC-type branched-subunit amino acid transport system substrate-binding protein
VFALLGPSEPAGDAKLPTLVLQTSAPALIYPRDELVFHVLPGLAEQAAVLVDFAARRAGPAPLRGAIVASGAAIYDQAAQAAGGRCAARGCGELVRIGWYAARFDAAAVVKRLKAEGREHLFFFGQDDEFERLLDEAGRAMDPSWQPAVYAPAALARTAVALRERFGGGVFLAFPTSPLGRSENGARAWQQLRQEFGLGKQYEAAQMAALAAATVLTEGLRRAGRELSRARLVQALESLNNYDPQGYGPAVSFGPDRRTGALGGYVVELAPGRGFLPASGWIALD